ncbi:hypothetical protein AHAS_Ahas11G0242300 [Arachis hypogaea]
MMVRGQILEFGLQRVRKIFHLPQIGDNDESYTKRVNRDQRPEQILADICLPGAQWRLNSEGQPGQLGRHDLKPVARR